MPFISKIFDNILMVIAISRGTYYIIFYKLFSVNVKIDFPFIAYAEVNISGPGKVHIGRRCTVVNNVFKGLSITTLSKNAYVTIGDRCLLGGLTIRCKSSVSIGNKSMTAVSLIQDVLCVNDNLNYIDSAVPIVIGENVWLGAHVCVLSGSVIANDSVIAACSTAYFTEVNEHSLYIGNFKRALPISKIIEMRK